MIWIILLLILAASIGAAIAYKKQSRMKDADAIFREAQKYFSGEDDIF